MASPPLLLLFRRLLARRSQDSTRWASPYDYTKSGAEARRLFYVYSLVHTVDLCGAENLLAAS
jgi:hypothetical protein